MGLSDIRLVVKLMCLCAAGRVEQSHSRGEGQAKRQISHSCMVVTDPGTTSPSCLTYLTTAIGALVENNPNACRLLVQLCTQVFI